MNRAISAMRLISLVLSYTVSSIQAPLSSCYRGVVGFVPCSDVALRRTGIRQLTLDGAPRRRTTQHPLSPYDGVCITPKRTPARCISCQASDFDIPAESTLRESLRNAIAVLERFGIPEPHTSAELLLSSVTGRTRSQLRLESATQDKLADGERAQFARFIAQRLKRVPVQYIVGEWDFYNLDGLRIRPPTLIPRPETEELVDRILQTCREESFTPSRFLEVGCGDCPFPAPQGKA